MGYKINLQLCEDYILNLKGKLVVKKDLHIDLRYFYDKRMNYLFMQYKLGVLIPPLFQPFLGLNFFKEKILPFYNS